MKRRITIVVCPIEQWANLLRRQMERKLQNLYFALNFFGRVSIPNPIESFVNPRYFRVLLKISNFRTLQFSEWWDKFSNLFWLVLGIQIGKWVLKNAQLYTRCG